MSNEYICKNCGSPFIKTRVSQSHCSSDCRKRYNYRMRYQKIKAERLATAPPMLCKQCGKKIEGRKRKFCNEACQKKFHAEKHKAEMRIKRAAKAAKTDRCECTIKEMCEYGTNSAGLMICGYMLMEGHPRGNYPEGDKCEFFKEKKKRRRGKRWGSDLDNKWE